MPKIKKVEQILKFGTNMLEVAEEWNQDVIVEHGEKLRDQLCKAKPPLQNLNLRRPKSPSWLHCFWRNGAGVH